MEVLILQVFVSFMLVTGAVLLFARTCRQKDYDHADRLALLPLDEEPLEGRRAPTTLRAGSGEARERAPKEEKEMR